MPHDFSTPTDSAPAAWPAQGESLRRTVDAEAHTAAASACLGPPVQNTPAARRLESGEFRAGRAGRGRGLPLLRWISRSNSALLLAILLVNALWLPYRGLQHDARLYAFELLNQTQGGRYHDALSRCYERAGQFSVFSNLAKPLVAACGVPAAFFALYLGSKLFQLFAMQRLVLALVPRRRWAVATLICLSGLSLGYGGLATFHVNESFLTPRLLATGLVLLGLERLLSSFTWQAAGCMLTAMLVHPVMGVVGLLVWGVWQAIDTLPILTRGASETAWRQASHRIGRARFASWNVWSDTMATFPWQYAAAAAYWGLLLLGAAAAGTLLLYRPAGIAVMGELDREWMDHIDDFNWYAIPSRWLATDWLRIGGTTVLLGLWAWLTAAPRQRRFAVCVLTVAWLGLTGSLLAERLPYALLFQAQTYRTLWLAQWAALPAAFTVAGIWWQRRTWAGSQAAFALLSLFVLQSPASWSLANLLFAAGWRLRRRKPVPPVPPAGAAWGRFRLAVGCWVLASLLSMARAGRGVVPLAVQFHESLDLYFWWRLVARALGPCLTIGIALGVLALLARTCRRLSGWQMATLVLALALQSLAFSLPYSPWRAWTGAGEYRTLSMVRDYVRQHGGDPQQRLPSVFWAGADPGYLWFEVGAKSYFGPSQLAGTMFLRSSALEGRRRAQVVSAVEIPAIHPRRPRMPLWQQQIFADVYRIDDSTMAHHGNGWQALLEEEELDLVVTPRRIEGCYAATNGRDYLYDLRRHRGPARPGLPAARRAAAPRDLSLSLGGAR